MLVSVIIPVYNRRDLLAKCLESVTAQRYDDWEVVVVDDGSTEDVATDLDPGDSRIRYVRQENAGPSVARNRGVENARGEALLFLDSDDVLLPDALSVLVEGLAAHPAAEVAYGWFYLMTSEEEPRAMACLSEQPAAPSASPWSDADASAYGLRAQGNPTAALLQDDALVMGSALLRRPAVERPPVEGDGARVGAGEAGDKGEERRLATARGAEDGEHLVRDGEVDGAEFEPRVPLRDPVEV